ncbi:MAG: hypothetical protein M1828_006234 [Chrysothrix sp. TS-e1954]|nr:MAG: hypothetical protein M1828_006234 [Chrysothrix sp. TS-e1954]
MQYRYAGGLNTPGAEAASRLEEDDDFERDFRRRRTTWKEATPDSGRQVFTVGGLSRERNGGRKRGRQSSVAALDQSESWSSYVARVAGGIAGAVWTFCSDTAFTGFKAGGGVTYDWQSMHTPRHDGHTRGSTPIPGQFPEDYEAVDENSPSADMEGRPAKRRQTTQGSNDDWVMVGGAGSSHNNASSTSYAKPSSAPALAQRSRLPRYSPSSRPSLDRQPRPHASTARLIASGTPPHAHKPSHPSRAASYASPRASLTAPRQSHTPKKLSPNNKSSPLPAELEEFTKQRDREDHQADARMRRMNKQLKAMIAEGQQALAFKFEATGPDDAMEGHLEDEGYGEGYASDDLAGLNAKLI